MISIFLFRFVFFVCEVSGHFFDIVDMVIFSGVHSLKVFLLQFLIAYLPCPILANLSDCKQS